ncbi:DUF779 domain-containing protein [Paracoccus marcusii]|nr:DUF779 domain-containing protein [Paracoccus marcusii]
MARSCSTSQAAAATGRRRCAIPRRFPRGRTRRAAGRDRRRAFYISASQAEAWAHTDLIIDVVPGRGGMFSLDNGREKRFLTRSEMCSI